MNILHDCSSDISGGAARAAYRINRIIIDHGSDMDIHSHMRVIRSLSDDPTVSGGLPTKHGMEFAVSTHSSIDDQDEASTPPITVSIHSPGLILVEGMNCMTVTRDQVIDLVHLHWLGDSTLSIVEIGKLPMPLDWTLHDQWPFCGAEHYTSPPLPGEIASSDERFAVSYSSARRPSHGTGLSLNESHSSVSGMLGKSPAIVRPRTLAFRLD